MKFLSPLSFIFLGAALVLVPAFGMAQHAPSPETAIPRHTDKGGHGNFAPPAGRKLPPDPRHDIPAHPNQAKHAQNTKNANKAKNDSAGGKSNGSAKGSDSTADSQ